MLNADNLIIKVKISQKRKIPQTYRIRTESAKNR